MNIKEPAKKFQDTISKKFKNILKPENHPKYKTLLHSYIIYPPKAKKEIKELEKFLPYAKKLTSNSDTIFVLLGINTIEKFSNITNTPIIFAENNLYSWKNFRNFAKNFININTSLLDSTQNDTIIIIYPPQSENYAKELGKKIQNNFKIKPKYLPDTNFKNIIISFKSFIPPAEVWIRIVKSKFELYLYKGNQIIKSYKIGIGKNEGDKQKVGDMRTPEGDFYIISIHDSRNWTHDFKDGKGPIKGAYGPWFLRLYTGADRTKSGKSWSGIGIHGTHDPSSIGKNVSEGCIRMNNKDIEELKKFVKIGTRVIIEP